MAVNLEWDDAWAFLNNISDPIYRDEFLAQEDWSRFMSGIASKYQIEVLKNAPDVVIEQVKNVIHLDTRLALNNRFPKTNTEKSNLFGHKYY